MQRWNAPCNLPPEIRQYHRTEPAPFPAPPRHPGRGRGTVDKTGQATRQRQRRAILARWGPVCWLCGKGIDLTLAWPDPRCFTRDHVLPRSKGGTDALENLRPAHRNCNSLRGNGEAGR